jgi:5-methylcytosine-specific restriction endonuclease McrA
VSADYPDRSIYIKGKCVCVYCGFDGRTSVLAWHQLVIDHVIPLRVKAGEREQSILNVPENKAVACFPCNNIKRVWDKKYEDEPEIPLLERVAQARKSATEFIMKRYAVMDEDFTPMMEDISERD